MKDITGFGTTEDEFAALPIAVRRKVRVDVEIPFCSYVYEHTFEIPTLFCPVFT